MSGNFSITPSQGGAISIMMALISNQAGADDALTSGKS